MNELDVLVVGGGISGLAVAHCLSRSGLGVELWEGSERVGGKIQTVSKDGYRLERAASMVMNFRTEVNQFLHTAGLESGKRARAPGSRRYVSGADQLYEVPSSFNDLFKSPIFSTRGKLRLLLEPLIPRGTNSRESVAEFVTRRLGREFLEKMFEPYIAGPLANDVDRAEAIAIVPKLVALERRYGSLALGALFRKAWSRGGGKRPEVFSFAGGMESMVETLASQGGFPVRNKIQVSEVWPVSGGWITRGMDGNNPRTIFSRQLILSTPPDAAANLVSGLDTELTRLLRNIEYSPVNIVHTGFSRARIRHPLKGSGFLVPRNSGFEVNGCLWMSSLFRDHAPEGKVLLSSYLGGARNPAAADWDSDRSLDAVMKMMGTLLDIKVDPDMLHIESHTRALPLYHGGYSQQLAAIDRRLKGLPGLYLEANYRGGVSVRDRILRADAVARQILHQRDESSRQSTSLHIPVIAQNIPPAPTTAGLL